MRILPRDVPAFVRRSCVPAVWLMCARVLRWLDGLSSFAHYHRAIRPKLKHTHAHTREIKRTVIVCAFFFRFLFLFEEKHCFITLFYETFEFRLNWKKKSCTKVQICEKWIQLQLSKFNTPRYKCFLLFLQINSRERGANSAFSRILKVTIHKM